MTAFMQETTGQVETEVGSKLVKDISVTAISIFGVLITIFISASVVPTEVEQRTIYTVLSKPVRRFQYLLGKFAGIQLIIIVNLLLMTALFFIAIYAKERIPPTLLLWSTLLVYFEFLIVSAFTFAVSCTATSAVLPTIAGLFIYITGNLTTYLQDVWAKSGQIGADSPVTAFIDQWIGKVAYGLYHVLPNLQYFSLRNEILHLQPNDPLPTDVLITNLVAYGLIYAVAGFLISYWIFWRKEL
jgi:ABC-type transport system involved in multi-copper enzyme maturation permease subunit